MEADDDVPLILTWDDVNSGLLNEETERADESKWNYIYHLCIGIEIDLCMYSCDQKLGILFWDIMT